MSVKAKAKGGGIKRWQPWPGEDEEEVDLAEVVEDGLPVVVVVAVAAEEGQDAVWCAPAKPTLLCWLSFETSMKSA